MAGAREGTGEPLMRQVGSECNFRHVAPRRIVLAMLDRAGSQPPPGEIVRRLDFSFYTDPVDATLKAVGVSGVKMKRVLVSCTGNTCRSAMAAGLLRAEMGCLGRAAPKATAHPIKGGEAESPKPSIDRQWHDETGSSGAVSCASPRRPSTQ
jgi:hypothetical protein